MKKTLVFILALAMIVSCFCISAAAWNGSSKADFAGSGTEADPYVIDAPEKLAKLAELVNGGESYAGKYFTQTADIDLGGKEWTPIGSSSKPFSGVYNGLGHKITGLYISNIISQCGLFGYMTSTADNQAGIANLTLDGKIVSDAMTVDAGLGLLCGWSYKDGTDNFKHNVIQNIVVNGEVKITNCAKQPRVGGVIGYCFDSVVENVVFNGSVEYTGSAVSRIGGVIGQTNRTTFRNVVNNGDVTVTNTAGNATGAGIASVATFKTENVFSDFENCINNGKITVTADSDATGYAAGILGQPYSSGANYFYKFNGCVNNGEIVAKTASTTKYIYVGGIAAYGNKGQMSVTGCVNTAALTAEGGPASRAGGIVGCFSGAATLDGVKFENSKSVMNAFGYVTSGIDVSTNSGDTSAADAKAAADAVKAGIKGAVTKINGFPTEAVSGSVTPDTPAVPENPQNPSTGDNAVWFAVVGAAALLGTAVVIRRRDSI